MPSAVGSTTWFSLAGGHHGRRYGEQAALTEVGHESPHYSAWKRPVMSCRGHSTDAEPFFPSRPSSDLAALHRQSPTPLTIAILPPPHNLPANALVAFL